MKLLVDMNLSPRWCPLLKAEGWDWSDVGRGSAPDSEIMTWARQEGRVVLTHNLDFGAMLAAARTTGPSVVQIRTQDVRPESLGPLLVPLLRQHELELKAGALMIADEARARVRVLPLRGKSDPTP